MKHSLFLAALAGALAGCDPKADVVVRPDGDVPSLSAALAQVRELRARGEIPSGRPAEIAVAPGRYHVTEPVRLTPADSGLRITGLGWDSTVIDGGVEIGPFAEGAGGVWEAKVPAGLVFEQLWVDDRRATRARTPNEGLYFYMRDQDEADPCGAFFAAPQDLETLAGLSADERQKVQVVYWLSWDMGFAALRSVDFLSGHVTTARKGSWKLFYWDKTCPRYVLENYRAALDAPGEWFLDTAASKLFYKPRPGERLGVTKAYAPVVETVLRIEGDVEKGAYVKDVRFTGLGFEFSKLAIGPDGIPNAQSASNVRTAAVEAEGADGLEFRNCRIAHTGGHGVWIRGGSVRSALEHTLVEDLGAGGVYFGDGKRELQKLERNSSFLTLHDSIVRHGGRILNSAVGVWLGQVNDCRVVHNEIADFLYTGVSMGWNWGYMETTTRRNHVDFNHIHHIQQGRLSDGGAFYSLGNQTGSTVCNNWIHDVNGYRDNGSPAWGLYTDEGSAHILLASNLVERCRSGAIHQHYGTENTYANNIFATFDEYGAWRSRTEDHVTIRVTNNIFWWTNSAARAYFTHAKGPSKNLPADGNVYWCASGAPAPDAFNFVSWETWRAGGMDATGAIADPLFVDPAHGDWTLKPDSPALKAGFKPFDWRQAGVLKDDPAWVAKAAEETWDVFKDAPKAPLYCREKAAADFERLGTGVLKSAMGALAPLVETPGRAGTIEIVDRDAAQGKKALRLTELPGLKSPWQPMVELRCRLVDGIARFRFSVKGDARCRTNFEARDYDSDSGFRTGAVMCLAGEEFRAGGRKVCTVPAGTWVDVDVALTLSGPKQGAWSCTATPRGGQPNTVRLPKFQDAAFRHLTWIGFISYGPEGSSWCLDDIRLWKEQTPADPRAPRVPVPDGIGTRINPTAKHIQRTMKTMAESTAENPATVRLLFYGQSIVGQQWHRILMEGLKRKYPTVRFEVENRAIGGFTSQLLIRTAESDLYPYYPDLLFFHVYGPLDKYEQILRNVRARTTAEIVLWTSHLERGASPVEMLATRDARSRKIIELAEKYGCLLVDLNQKWCRMLLENGWGVQDVLKDNIHMKDGKSEWPSLRYYSGFIGEDLCRLDGLAGEPEVSGTVTSVPFSETLAFEGNRVVAVMDGTGGGNVRVTLDGRAPSANWDMYVSTRPSAPISWMPLVLHVDCAREAQPVAEDWTLTYLAGTQPFGPIHYRVAGSVTGADGEGWSDRDFVSTSGRALIPSSDFHIWQYDYFVKKPGRKNLEARPGQTVTWQVRPLGLDVFRPGAAGTRLTLVQGCANGRHKLQLSSPKGVTGIRSFLVYKPAAR